MTTLTIPPGVNAAGRRNAIFVPTDTLSVATLSGPTAVEVICYLTKGTFGVAGEVERGTDERECATESAEVFGNTKHTLNDLEYVWEPQDDGSSDTNKAYNTLKEGTTGFLIIRYGLPNDTALAADQIVDKYPVTLGPQFRKTPESGNAAEKLKISQPVTVGLGVKFDQALIA